MPPGVLVEDYFQLNEPETSQFRKVIPCIYQSSQAFLNEVSKEGGGYTTGRTVERNAILELETHVERLARSTWDIFHVDPKQLTLERVRNILIQNLKLALQTYENEHPNHENEMKLSIIVTKHKEDIEQRFCMMTHVTELSKPPQNVHVEVRGSPRHNPTIKDSEWIRARKALEEQMGPDVNEVLLHDNKYRIYEGLSSNFFAVQVNGTVVTAPADQVLEGTIRKIILAVCNEHQIPVVFEAPDANNRTQWQGALISSTSRIALSINSIRFPDITQMKEHFFEPTELVNRIRDLTFQKLRQHCTPLV